LLQQRTGVPTLAVIPLLRDHGLPEEDAVPGDSCNDAGHRGPRVVVLATPHASNLDEFEPLRAAGVALQFSRDAATLARADWLILPGSKHSRADLAWVRGQGLEAVVHAHVAAGRPLLRCAVGCSGWARQSTIRWASKAAGPGRIKASGCCPCAPASRRPSNWARCNCGSGR
jgi:adenosylcobyric acid synthase